MIAPAAAGRFAALVAARRRWLVLRCAHHARRRRCGAGATIFDAADLAVMLASAILSSGSGASSHLVMPTGGLPQRGHGTSLPTLLAGLKCCRDACRDLVRFGGFAPSDQEMLDHAIVRIFDTLELDCCAASSVTDGNCVPVGRIRHLQVLGAMTRGLAHEINNLLQPVIGMAFSVRRKLPPDSAEARNLTMILDAGKQASAVVNDLLGLARNRCGAPEPVDPLAEVERAVALLGRRSQPGVSIRTDLEPVAARRVLLTPGALTQATLNLAVNGLEAMAQGGGTLTIALRGTDATVILEVRDAGSGMAPEVLARCRELFFTTKPADAGAGLGLPVVQDIVSGAGGMLTIDSAPGCGTAARITLPAFSAAAP